MAVEEYSICFAIKLSGTDCMTFLCVQFCFGLVRNSTSPRKNAGTAGYFTLYQSVVLFLEMFVFDVFQKVANLCVCGCYA